VLISFLPLLCAQETINYSSVGGRVTDPSGASSPPPDYRTTARNQPHRRSVTDRDGRFRFPYLRGGAYEIKVQHQGFADFTRALTSLWFRL
jgi:hypothetical protein